MKKRSLLLGLLLPLGLFSQATWLNYVNDYIIFDLALEGNNLWAATHGGLVKMDITNGAKETFQASDSGLRSNYVVEVEIADDGTVWLGSWDTGLYQWNGSDWQNFYFINTGDTIYNVSHLTLAANGDLWFLADARPGCSGCNMLFSYDGNEFENHRSNLGLSTTEYIENFTFINGTEQWVVAENELLRYDGEEVLDHQSLEEIGLPHNEYIRHLVVDDQENLWITTTRATANDRITRILHFDGTAWIVEDDDPPGYVERLFKDEHGTLWFNFANQFNYRRSYAAFDGTNWQYWPYGSTDVPFLGLGPMLHLVDADGKWWMSTNSGINEPKVYSVDNEGITPYDTQIVPVGSNHFDNFLTDCDNNKWLLSTGLLSKFDGQNWESFPEEETGFDGSPWQAALDPQTCDLWFALYSSSSGGPDVGRYDGSDFTTYALGSGSAQSVEVSTDGTVYVGTTSLGVARYLNDEWTYLDEDNSPLANRIQAIEAQDNGSLWVASTQRGVARWENEQWTVFDNSNSPVATNCYWIYEDSQQQIWVSANDGLARYNGTTWEYFPLDLMWGGILDTAEDTYGNFWLTTPTGAAYWNGFTLDFYNIDNSGIANNVVWHVLIDAASNDIWFQQHYGISILRDFNIGNSINGLVFFDFNQNGEFDSTEDLRLPHQEVWLLPDSIRAITNSLGAYTFYPETTGAYEVTYVAADSYTPTSATTLDVNLENSPIIDQDFGTWTENLPEKMTIDVATGPLVCNEPVNIWVTFRNEGLLPILGEITLGFPAGFTYLEAHPEASSVNTTEVSWSFSDLPFMQSRTYRLTLIAPGVEELDQAYEFVAGITSAEQSEFTKEEQVLLCSYDPNDKLASAVGQSAENYSLLGDPLQYTIRFQNRGNYRAKDIEIRDLIDPSLDLATLEILSSSHAVTTTITDSRELVFHFKDIYLPPDEEDYLLSQGFVKYQISPLPGLADFTLVENTAAIYFDLNPAIITNTTENILVETLDVATEEPGQVRLASIYPNPSRAGVWIDWQDTSEQAEWEVEVFDLTGRLLLRHQGTTTREQVIIPPPGGLYLLRIRKGDYLQTDKVVIWNH